MLFDTHCHLDFTEFEDVSLTIQQAMDVDVHRFLLPATTQVSWSGIESLIESFPTQLFGALGYHPYFLSSEIVVKDSMYQLDRALQTRSKQILAVGECGLDGMVDVDFALQTAMFSEQVCLAQHYRLPLIIHSRKTHHHILRILKRARFTEGGVLHGFTGSKQQAYQLVDMGLKIGVGGSITYPRAQKTRQAIAALPLESLVLETDAPDMPVQGFQGQPNHPNRLPIIFQSLLELRAEEPDKVRDQLWQNSLNVLHLSSM